MLLLSGKAGLAFDTKFPPEVAHWESLKHALTAPDGREYFEMGMKDPLIATLRGKVVMLDPGTNPKTLVLAIAGVLGRMRRYDLTNDCPAELMLALS